MLYRKSKYHNRKVEWAGEKFDSQKELNRWLELKLLQRAGRIHDLQRQTRWEVIPKQCIDGVLVERPCYYVADFEYKNPDGSRVVEDTKGVRTPEYIIKRKLMLYIHGITIREVTKP